MPRLILLLIIIFATACRIEPDNTQLALVMPGDPKSLDPAFATDVRSGQLVALLYDNLVKFGHGNDILPSIASSWDISDDGTNYIFYLRSDIKFQNEQLLTAKDVQFSFERILNPQTKSHRKWLFSNIKGAQSFVDGKTNSVEGIKVYNDTTLTIILENAFTPFIGFLAMPSASIVTIDKKNQIVGTGPWKLKEWIHDGHILLDRNENYFSQPSKLSSLKIRILPEALPRTAEFITGYLDIMDVPESEYSLWESDSEWAPYIQKTNDLNTYYIGLNCSRPPFDNKLVRQAVNYAVNIDAIITSVKHNNCQFAKGPTPPGLLPEKRDKVYYYNPEKAKSLLVQAGFDNGFEVDLWQSQSSDLLFVTEAIQAQLAEVGITVNIIRNDWNMYSKAVREGVPDMYYRSWYADYPDAENFLTPLFESEVSKKRWTRYANSELDSIIYRIQVELDEDVRDNLIMHANHILVKDAPWVYLWHSQSVVITNPKLRGWSPSLMFNAEKYTEVFKHD
jgi:peptide/nickel transport system substrate-binding protein/oligopeptide transport system substrate-binding protein